MRIGTNNAAYSDGLVLTGATTIESLIFNRLIEPVPEHVKPDGECRYFEVTERGRRAYLAGMFRPVLEDGCEWHHFSRGVRGTIRHRMGLGQPTNRNNHQPEGMR